MALQTSGKPIDQLLERVLCMNIINSDYWKEIFRVKTYTEVVDEIYEHVEHVEPWMSGNCRGPSTSFCLLYKLFTLELTAKQVHGLLDHGDSPYIRAVGFLYLRYVAEPKTLWSWYEPYLRDEEVFSPGSGGKETTMGIYIRDLLLGQYYFDSLLPRIPVLVMREMASNLDAMGLPSKPCGVAASLSRLGADEGQRRPPSVKAALSVSFGQRVPHRAATRGSSPVRRGMPLKETSRDAYLKRDAEKERSRDREKEREREKVRDDDRDRDRDRDREHDRLREVDRNRQRDSERARDRDRDRDRDRERSRDGGRQAYARSRSRSPRRERSYDRDRERSRRDDRDRGRDRGPDRRYSSRERSPERGRERGRDVDREDRDRDDTRGAQPGKESAATTNLKKLRDLYGDSGSAPKGGDEKNGGGEDVIRLGGSSWR
eukprot:jgi/Mesen1/3118/ME000184S02182